MYRKQQSQGLSVGEPAIEGGKWGAPRGLSQRLAISGRRIQQSPRDLGRPFAVEVLFLPAPSWCLFLAFSYFFFLGTCLTDAGSRYCRSRLAMAERVASSVLLWTARAVMWAGRGRGPRVSRRGLLRARCRSCCPVGVVSTFRVLSLASIGDEFGPPHFPLSSLSPPRVLLLRFFLPPTDSSMEPQIRRCFAELRPDLMMCKP